MRLQTVFHDPCYLGRGNGIFEAPRKNLKTLNLDVVETKRNKNHSFCCGAGGAQVFKESEKNTTQINHIRTKELIETGAKQIATACPFCKLMFRDSLNEEKDNHQIVLKDIAELIAEEI